MSQETLLDKYFKNLQIITIEGNKNPATIPNILQYINDQNNNKKELSPFFEGEKLFYKGQYQESLKNYKKASQIKNIGFYYCRAAAFILASNNNYNDAIKVIKKALNIIPNDYVSLEFLINTLIKNNQKSETKQWIEKKEKLSEIFFDKKHEDKITKDVQKELEELSHILSDSEYNPDEDIMFFEDEEIEDFPPQAPLGTVNSFSVLSKNTDPLLHDMASVAKNIDARIKKVKTKI